MLDVFEQGYRALQSVNGREEMHAWYIAFEYQLLPILFSGAMKVYNQSVLCRDHPLPYSPEEFVGRFREYEPRARALHSKIQMEIVTKNPLGVLQAMLGM